MTARLSPSSQFIDPRWINSLHGEIIETVTENRQVIVHGQVLNMVGEGYPPGEKVRVWFGRNIYCQSLKEYEAEINEKRRIQLETQEKDRQAANRKRGETLAFNQSLNVPVSWQTGFKDVLSGLSEHSMGNGMNKATVGHIEFKEDYQVGRLTRKSGEFLCARQKGKQWTGISHFQLIDGNGNYYDARVTCKKCLSMAARWK